MLLSVPCTVFIHVNDTLKQMEYLTIISSSKYACYPNSGYQLCAPWYTMGVAISSSLARECFLGVWVLLMYLVL